MPEKCNIAAPAFQERGDDIRYVQSDVFLAFHAAAVVHMNMNSLYMKCLHASETLADKKDDTSIQTTKNVSNQP
jgi:hypothetical protein